MTIGSSSLGGNGAVASEIISIGEFYIVGKIAGGATGDDGKDKEWIQSSSPFTVYITGTSFDQVINPRYVYFTMDYTAKNGTNVKPSASGYNTTKNGDGVHEAGQGDTYGSTTNGIDINVFLKGTNYRYTFSSTNPVTEFKNIELQGWNLACDAIWQTKGNSNKQIWLYVPSSSGSTWDNINADAESVTQRKLWVTKMTAALSGNSNTVAKITCTQNLGTVSSESLEITANLTSALEASNPRRTEIKCTLTGTPTDSVTLTSTISNHNQGYYDAVQALKWVEENSKVYLQYPTTSSNGTGSGLSQSNSTSTSLFSVSMEAGTGNNKNNHRPTASVFGKTIYGDWIETASSAYERGNSDGYTTGHSVGLTEGYLNGWNAAANRSGRTKDGLTAYATIPLVSNGQQYDTSKQKVTASKTDGSHSFDFTNDGGFISDSGDKMVRKENSSRSDFTFGSYTYYRGIHNNCSVSHGSAQLSDWTNA